MFLLGWVCFAYCTIVDLFHKLYLKNTLLSLGIGAALVTGAIKAGYGMPLTLQAVGSPFITCRIFGLLCIQAQGDLFVIWTDSRERTICMCFSLCNTV